MGREGNLNFHILPYTPESDFEVVDPQEREEKTLHPKMMFEFKSLHMTLKDFGPRRLSELICRETNWTVIGCCTAFATPQGALPPEPGLNYTFFLVSAGL